MMASAYCLAFLFHISVLVERSKFLVMIFEAGNFKRQTLALSTRLNVINDMVLRKQGRMAKQSHAVDHCFRFS